MPHIDPAIWTQLIIAITTLLVAVAGWIKSNTNSKKIDQNTALTQDIHQTTNGSMTANNPAPVPPVVAPTGPTGPSSA